MNWLKQDLFYALRLLLKNPAFALVTVLVFAVGIGTNVAIFTLINSILLKPLPYANSDRLVVALHEGTLPVSPADYADYRREAKSFDQIGAAQAGGANLSGGARPEAVPALRMTASVFRVLGVPPLLGRTFTPEEEHEPNSSVVVLSYDLWQTHFGGLRNVIGSKVRLDGVPFTVIGVMPQTFRFAPFWATHAQMWSPLVLDARRDDRGGRSLRVFARLKENVALGQAQVEMDAIARRLAATYPTTNKNLGIRVVPLREKVVGNIRPTLLVLMATVGFVLLIACANIANFVLTKVIERRKEFALRKAIGASTPRLVRMLLTELFVLGIFGGTAGVLLAYSLVDLLPKLLPVGDLPRMQEVAVDNRALLFALAATAVSVLLAGFAPMLQISGADVNESLKEGGRGGTESKGRRRIRSLLVAAEVAISLVLLAGAGLMIRTMARLQSVDAGFDPRNVLSFQVSLGGTDFNRNGARVAVFRQILSRLAALPGVRSASAINHLPIGGDVWSLSYRVEGRPAPPPGEGPSAVYRVVMPGYFQTMKIALLQGREFNARDRENAGLVAIVNQALAQKQWPGQNPLGERVQFAAAFGTYQTFTIVGVARNAKQGEWVGTPKDEIYLSYLQRPDTFGLSSLAFVLRTDVDPAKLVEPALSAVGAVDPNLAVSSVLSMEQVVHDSLWRSRLVMLLLEVFAGIAALLAALGIYGAISYSVNRRTQEIGIRMALGANSWQVLKLAFGEGVGPVLAGVLAGFAGAVILSRLMTSLLYGVSATDPATFSAVLLVLTFISCAAIFVPAVRASRLDPVEALREE